MVKFLTRCYLKNRSNCYLCDLTKFNVLKNPKAIKLLNKLIDDTEQNGIITNTAVADLKKLRPYAVEEEQPLLAKIIRLTFEHIEEYETFAIGIPDDDPIEDEEGEIIEKDDEDKVENGEHDPNESFLYLLNLIADPENKTNKLDMRAYVENLKEYAEEN